MDKYTDTELLAELHKRGYITNPIWRLEDIREQARYLDIKLSNEQVLQVREKLEETDTSEPCISWDVIATLIYEVEEND